MPRAGNAAARRRQGRPDCSRAWTAPQHGRMRGTETGLRTRQDQRWPGYRPEPRDGGVVFVVVAELAQVAGDGGAASKGRGGGSAVVRQMQLSNGGVHGGGRRQRAGRRRGRRRGGWCGALTKEVAFNSAASTAAASRLRSRDKRFACRLRRTSRFLRQERVQAGAQTLTPSSRADRGGNSAAGSTCNCGAAREGDEAAS